MTAYSLDLFLVTGGWLELLEPIDKQLLLSVNGSHSLYLDRVVRALTAAQTWIPFYLSLFYIVMQNNNHVRKVLSILVAVGMCVLLAGSVDDLLVKPLVARWRPTHDPEIGILVDIVDGYRGGKYGFFSAHASNTFSIAVFFCWLIRSRLLSIAMVIWSLTNCWTRLYLGVHFPGDILVGLIWGFIVGSVVYAGYSRFIRRLAPRHLECDRHLNASQYTQTGYKRADTDIPVAILVITLLVILIKSTIL